LREMLAAPCFFGQYNRFIMRNKAKNRLQCKKFSCVNRNFFASNENKGEIKNSKYQYTLLLKPNGHPPRSGLFVCDFLDKIDLFGARVLDVGIGESAILSIHAVFAGAQEVVGIDIDCEAIKWAKKNIGENNLNGKVTVKNISIEDFKDSKKFDYVISNPPQMPAKKIVSTHDDGGRDGRRYIKKIIKFSSKSLNTGGALLLTAFDFLGVVDRYGEAETICTLLQNFGFRIESLGSYIKTARRGSYTEKSLPWIKKIYPRYRVERNSSGKIVYKMFVIEARKA